MNDEVLTTIITTCERRGAAARHEKDGVDVCVDELCEEAYQTCLLQVPLVTALVQEGDALLSSERSTQYLSLFRKGYDLLKRTSEEKISIFFDDLGMVNLHTEADGIHATYRFRK